MPVSAAALPVSAHDRAVLRRWANASQAPATLVRRAKILLLAGEGVANTQIAERLEVSRPTVIAWRKRYAREGSPDSWPTTASSWISSSWSPVPIHAATGGTGDA